MRILLISHTCQSAAEGQPKAELLGSLPGVELTVLVPDRWLHYGNWRLASVPDRSSYNLIVGDVDRPWCGPAQWYLHSYRNLHRIVEEVNPQVIDLWEEPWNLLSAQACALRDRYFPAVRIVSETEQNIWKHLPYPFEHYRTRTLRSANYVIGRSAEAIDVVRRKGYRGPAAVVPNAVDEKLFRPLARDACREQLELSGFVVGYVGRLVPEKGLSDLIDMLAYLPDEVNVLIVGDGPSRAELEARASAVDVLRRVRFLEGRSLQDLPKVMCALDTLVLPSVTTARWKEQFGRVLIEAQSCRIPVIGTNSGAIPDVVGSAGIVVPEGEPLALAHAVKDLLDDRALSATLGAIGRRQVERLYTWEKVAQNMHVVYKDVLSRPVDSTNKGFRLPSRLRGSRKLTALPD